MLRRRRAQTQTAEPEAFFLIPVGIALAKWVIIPGAVGVGSAIAANRIEKGRQKPDGPKKRCSNPKCNNLIDAEARMCPVCKADLTTGQ